MRKKQQQNIFIDGAKHNTMHKTICFVAGKSGGHLIPCITLAKEYKQKKPTTHIHFITSNYALDKKIMSDNLMSNKQLLLSLSIKKRWYNLPFFLAKLCVATIKSFRYLFKHKPQKIISTGGIIAAPVCIAGWLLRIPIELFELNAVPGKAIRFLTPLATKNFVCFNQAQQFFPIKKTAIKQYPIRFEKKNSDRNTSLKKLKLNQNKKTILILGGSQGSLFINSIIKKVITKQPLTNTINVIHQTGNHDISQLEKFYIQQNIPAYVFQYHDDLASFYSSADLVICRSGAGTLFESLFFEKPIITIPLHIKSTSHQKDNAYACAQQYPNLVHVLLQNEVEKNINLLANKIEIILKLK